MNDDMITVRQMFVRAFPIAAMLNSSLKSRFI